MGAATYTSAIDRRRNRVAYPTVSALRTRHYSRLLVELLPPWQVPRPRHFAHTYIGVSPGDRPGTATALRQPPARLPLLLADGLPSVPAPLRPSLGRPRPWHNPPALFGRCVFVRLIRVSIPPLGSSIDLAPSQLDRCATGGEFRQVEAIYIRVVQDADAHYSYVGRKSKARVCVDGAIKLGQNKDRPLQSRTQPKLMPPRRSLSE